MESAKTELNEELNKLIQADKSFGVAYVILYDFTGADAAIQLKKLVRSLHDAGLDSAVRPAKSRSLFIFVRPRKASVRRAVQRFRTRDWLYGVRSTQPTSDTEASGDPETEAENLRTIYYMITLPRSEGAAGITPNHGEWVNVKSIFPLHDKRMNKEWVKNWSHKTFLDQNDLDQIRAVLGEKVAFYFAFLQAYFAFLFIPAGLGLLCWLFLGSYSIIYSILNSFLCLIFVEYWKQQETDLGLRWQVKGVSAIKAKRKEFQHEKEFVDPITGEKVLSFPHAKRFKRQLLILPFTFLAIFLLGTLIASCFAIEIFISEVYSGPFKSYLTFIPTILLSLFVPTVTTALTSIATNLTEYENYETQDSYDVALTQKIFVLNFVTSYLPIFLTAFVYVPCARIIVPYLDVLQLIVRPFQSEKAKVTAQAAAKDFQIDQARLKKQVIYFTVTAQIVNLGLETVLPFVKRKLSRKYQEYQEQQSEEQNKTHTPNSSQSSILLEDVPDEAHFLSRVRRESELNDYDVTTDLREMGIQFGYLALFSPVWSLVPLSFLANNWVELRSDFIKICIEYKRPIPFRSDSIGPWLDSISFLSWLGSITSAALLYLFAPTNGTTSIDGDPNNIKGWLLLLTIFFAEHLYILARIGVQAVISKMETGEMRRERGERYLFRKNYLDDEELEERDTNTPDVEEPQETKDMITRKSLEESARKFSLHNSSPSEVFWARQRGWQESAKVGAAIIQTELEKSPTEKKQQ
ncbi:hypothetical protein FQN57_006540 [Myotisia sp. PD_48]|nr:hypothetical protein FQN57_006540 [Myotisia sp. PD_48]